MVICLERGVNDLHMVQLMPLPLPSLLQKIQNPSGTGLPRLSWKKAVKRVLLLLYAAARWQIKRA